ncbi:MAG TPA: hypothetical protein VK968_07675, partial [Roseimicrobium sp.]|nr:hypothetical protein [Roseimicrobium sp.]
PSKLPIVTAAPGGSERSPSSPSRTFTFAGSFNPESLRGLQSTTMPTVGTLAADVRPRHIAAGTK